MGAPGQFEVQLGHLCNDRCVFCISGHLTRAGRAPLLEAETVLAALERAHAQGHRRVTLLGGEPTIQPMFLEVVAHAAALGFEIVVFTNGSKAGRSDLVDRVADTGARVEWRFSFQGGDRAAHERTTGRRGSFDQLLRAVARASARGQRLTVNTCVVRHNYQSLPALPGTLAPFEVAQVHVDMVNPYDTWQYHQHDRPGAGASSLTAEGQGTAADARRAIDDLQPRYADLVAPLTEMIAGFPEGFDVNIGNLPFCVAPHLAPWIHHGGPPTVTTSVDIHGRRRLADQKRKYPDKATFRTKPDRCRTCAYDDRCAGVFTAYAEAYGTGELVPVDPTGLPGGNRGHPDLGAPRQAPGVPAPPVQAALARLRRAAPFGALTWAAVKTTGETVEVVLVAPEGTRAVVWLAAPGGRLRGGYRLDPEGADPSPALLEGLRQALGALGIPGRGAGRRPPGAPGR